ncbi:class I SAM-dependent methyltransferase [Mycobacterium sp. 663a-19]|uniref:class I SAM-dependent methyltransferase n=1 Tax=Mycobacterium sp. 663a-19 TaxID=2986148 RepID=UPI002D1F75B1|nr:class I SAM-dependent methyltransferase [Mycobacterium sp. 663a-19]MEB3981285.1 class I SAM-dependent methyltransferase [Mycobacterium sp. 663a-19]
MSGHELSKQRVALGGVAETALLTLNARAQEARRPNPVLDDPLAIAVVDSIAFDFAKFGRPRQDTALRARAYDAQALAYLDQHPTATVVALADGLQTSFWRLQAARPDGQFRWLTVDLPNVIDLRNRLLPSSPRVLNCAQSALDYSWMELVDPSAGVFITAEGLLMYLQPEQALGLITQCAKAFPGGQMLFDLPPAWIAKVKRSGIRTSRTYKSPPVPFRLSLKQAADLANAVPGIRAVHNLRLPPGRGRMFNAALSIMYRKRFLAPLRPIFTLLEFG